MVDWRELEREFRELEPKTGDMRIDYQWHEPSDPTAYWHLAGGPDPIETRRFEVLAAVAGRLLEAIPTEYLGEGVGRDSDPTRRWYRALWKMTGPHGLPLYGTMTNDGEPAGEVYVGRIIRPAAQSAVLALQLGSLPTTTPSAASTSEGGWLTRVNVALGGEAQKRGRVWTVAAVILGLLLAALAL